MPVFYMSHYINIKIKDKQKCTKKLNIWWIKSRAYKKKDFI
jgi:hypothetical protein